MKKHLTNIERLRVKRELMTINQIYSRPYQDTTDEKPWIEDFVQQENTDDVKTIRLGLFKKSADKFYVIVLFGLHLKM